MMIPNNSLLASAVLLSLGIGSPAAAQGIFGLPASGPTLPQADLRGPAYFSVGKQTVPNVGDIGSLDFGVNAGPAQMNASLVANPSNLMGFFGADINTAFVGHTGMFLPIDLMPFMGIGASMFLLEKTSSGGTTSTTAGLPFYTPIGLRYTLPIGGLSIGGEASYYYWLGDMLGENVNTSRWHFEGGIRLGALSLTVFNEDGPLLSGPGAKLGLNFGLDD